MKSKILLDKNNNLDKNKKYLLACSFGPDSMCLFNLLLENNINFVVAHVNYKKRSISDFEESSLMQTCKDHNIEFYSCSAGNFPKSQNFQATARVFRYNFFKLIYNQTNCDYLLIAHNLDDALETYIFNAQRNSYTRYVGLKYSINNFDMNIIRPLLSYEKKALQQYCDDNNVPYSIDSSNLTDVYTRNKIRHTIIEKMSKESKIAMLKDIDEENNRLEKLYEEIVTVSVNESYNIKSFYRMTKFDVIHILFYLIEKITHSNPKAGIIECLYGDILNGNVNIIYPIDDYFIVLEYSSIRVIKKETLNSFKNYRYKVEEAPSIFAIDIKEIKKQFKNEKNLYLVPTINYRKVKGSFGSKTVKRFFIDCKLPITFRKLWPCIVNEKDEVIYVPRYRKNYKYQQNQIFNFDLKDLLKL